MYKICSGCGKKFQCIGTEKCWCYQIKISDERLAELRSCHDDCFCKKCLLSKNKKLT